MLANVENTCDWLRANGLEHWTVSTREGENNYIFKTSPEEGLEVRFKRFQDVMRLSQGGRFIIKGRQDADAKKGWFTEEFANTPGTMNSQIGSVPQSIQGLTPDQVDAKIQDALNKANTERLLKEQADRIKELEAEAKERDGVKDRLISRVEPYIGTILPLLMSVISGKPINEMPQIGKLETSQPIRTNTVNTMSENNQPIGEQTDEQLQERLQNALEKLANADENFLSVIEKLADWAASGESISIMGGMVQLTYPQVTKMIL